MTTAGNIQGEPADATVDILKHHGITDTAKWVDNFDFLRHPISSTISPEGVVSYSYSFDLSTILRITEPLGIPWHNISEQGHDFAFTTEYAGFTWDLITKRVSLSDKKRFKYLSKINSFLKMSTVSEKDVASIHGTLQHATFVYRHGRCFLPALSYMITQFTNKWARHHISTAVRNDLNWWHNVLSHPSSSRSLLPRNTASYDIWVDASTTWGIGVIIDGKWMAWRLQDGWQMAGRDIGWAESVAVELAILWVVEQKRSDLEILIHGDNTNIIDAYKRGRSRNIARNASLRRITTSLIPSNLTLTPIYVPSDSNLADPISRGVLGPPQLRLVYLFKLP